MRILSITLTLILLAAACGERKREPVDLTTDAPGININGKEFWSTSVTENGQDRPMVDGTHISLRFEAGEIGVHAGCNSIGGTYTVDDDDVLVIDGLFSTEMGCEPERHAQDEFISAVLTSRPTLVTGTNTLTVATPTVTIELLDRELAETDESLLDTEWTVDGFFDPIAATAYAVDLPARLVFGSDGRATGFDGCEAFDIAYQATDTTITFAAAPSPDCSAYAVAFGSVLGRTTLRFEIQGPKLTLTAEDSTGLTARAD